MKKFGIQTVLGMAIAIYCIVSACIETGDVTLFWDTPSFLLVVINTIGFIIVSIPFSRLKTIGSVILKAFRREKYDLPADIEVIVRLSEVARREGILALESSMQDSEEEYDEFLKKGILMMVDGFDKRTVRGGMMAEINATSRRHKQSSAMLEMVAATAPALGLLGTYVGLIPMLVNLSDPDQLGPLMAVELVSSFYGAFIANILFQPLANRLKFMSGEEIFRKKLLLEGLLEIHEGVNPRQIRNDLINYLSQPEIDSLNSDKEEKVTDTPVKRRERA